MPKPKPTIFRGRPVSQEPEMDTTPVEMPLGFTTPTPLQDLIARMVREAVQMETDEEFESPEDADDFDMDDDGLLDLSPYELHEMQEVVPIAEAEPQPAPAPAPAEPEPGPAAKPAPDPVS